MCGEPIQNTDIFINGIKIIMETIQIHVRDLTLPRMVQGGDCQQKTNGQNLQDAVM